MNTFSYNINNDTVCCLACSNGVIRDISVIRSPNKTGKELVPTATESIARMVKSHNEKPIRFRYPPIEKGNKQKNMIMDFCRLDDKFEFKKTPFLINSSIASMNRSGRIRSVSFSDTSQPYTLYTDASVVDSEDPTVSSCLLNSRNEILYMVSQSIRSVANVTTAELIAGYLGLKICELNDAEEVEWYCDNNTVLRFVDGGQERKISESYFSNNIRSLFGSNEKYHKNRISGDKNKLADSMAKDVRHEEMNGSLEFRSPAFEDHEHPSQILNNIKRRTR